MPVLPVMNELSTANSVNEYSISAGNLTEHDWATVLRNCAVFYGWKVDQTTQRIVRAPRAAFRLRTVGLQDFSEPVFVGSEPTEQDPVEGVTDADMERPWDLQSTAQDEATARQAMPDWYVQAQSTNAVLGIPNFRTNDDSRIDITACADALAVSMAKSDFSSQSTEVGVSGGAMGVQVGVSAGFATSSENSKRDEHQESTQTLVARYMYPRCDLFLRPEDLEPTEEFARLLYKVKTYKSLDALRQIQSQYGQ